MKLKNGYTLAEILVTLSIVSVVAAITIPHLVLNTNEKALKPTINRAAAVLEQGLADIIFQSQNDNNTEGAITTLDGLTVDDIIHNGDNSNVTNGLVLFERCASFLNIQPTSDDEFDAYIEAFPTVNNNYEIYKFKKFNAYISVPAATNNIVNDDSVLKTIYIDGNGIKGPNTTQGDNPDIVEYDILNNGHVVKHS